MVSALEMGWYQQPATRFEWRYQTRWIYRDWAAGPGPGSWISGCGAVANLENIPGVVGYLCLFLFRYNLYDYMYFSKFLDVCWLWLIFFLVSLLIACFSCFIILFITSLVILLIVLHIYFCIIVPLASLLLLVLLIMITTIIIIIMIIIIYYHHYLLSSLSIIIIISYHYYLLSLLFTKLSLYIYYHYSHYHYLSLFWWSSFLHNI